MTSRRLADVICVGLCAVWGSMTVTLAAESTEIDQSTGQQCSASEALEHPGGKPSKLSAVIRILQAVEQVQRLVATSTADRDEHGGDDDEFRQRPRTPARPSQAQPPQGRRPADREVQERTERTERAPQERREQERREQERREQERREQERREQERREREKRPESRPEGRPDRPGEHREPLPPDRQIHHLRVAADNLHAAGLHEQAEKLLREAERIEHELRQSHPSDSVHREAVELLMQMRQEMRSMKGEIEGLRREVSHLRETLLRMPPAAMPLPMRREEFVPPRFQPPVRPQTPTRPAPQPSGGEQVEQPL